MAKGKKSGILTWIAIILFMIFLLYGIIFLAIVIFPAISPSTSNFSQMLSPLDNNYGLGFLAFIAWIIALIIGIFTNQLKKMIIPLLIFMGIIIMVILGYISPIYLSRGYARPTPGHILFIIVILSIIAFYFGISSIRKNKKKGE